MARAVGGAGPARRPSCSAKSLLAGETDEVEPAVLSLQQVQGEAPLPEAWMDAPADADQATVLEIDLLWERYFRYAHQVGRSRGSRFLAEWVEFEVALRNALAAARARRVGARGVGLPGRRGPGPQRRGSLAGAQRVGSGRRRRWQGSASVIRARWSWLDRHDAWFSFSVDELLAYAARVMLLEQWRRTEEKDRMPRLDERPRLTLDFTTRIQKQEEQASECEDRCGFRKPGDRRGGRPRRAELAGLLRALRRRAADERGDPRPRTTWPTCRCSRKPAACGSAIPSSCRTRCSRSSSDRGCSARSTTACRTRCRNWPSRSVSSCSRAYYIHGLSLEQQWDFTPWSKPGDVVAAGRHAGHRAGGRVHPPDHGSAWPGAASTPSRRSPPAGQYTVEQEIAVLAGPGRPDSTRDDAAELAGQAAAERLRGGGCCPPNRWSRRVRIIDSMFPIVRGGTYCIPGPFGAGKTVLQQITARHAEIDIVIIAACGERAGEIVETLRDFPELTDPRTGRSLMERTIIIANTSAMPVAAREASVYTAADAGRVLPADGPERAAAGRLAHRAGPRRCGSFPAGWRRSPARRRSRPTWKAALPRSTNVPGPSSLTTGRSAR